MHITSCSLLLPPCFKWKATGIFTVGGCVTASRWCACFLPNFVCTPFFLPPSLPTMKGRMLGWKRIFTQKTWHLRRQTNREIDFPIYYYQLWDLGQFSILLPSKNKVPVFCLAVLLMSLNETMHGKYGDHSHWPIHKLPLLPFMSSIFI